MNRNNRYCCIVIPCEIYIKCNYFELELENKNLKKIIIDINKEINSEFSLEQATIDDNYGVLMYDKQDINNQYVKTLTGKDKKGQVLLITHVANLDEFLKTPHLIEKTYSNIELISHNSVLAKKMILLCMYYIIKNSL